MKKIVLSSIVAATCLFAQYKEVSIENFKDLNILTQYGVSISKAYDTGSIYHLKASIRGKIQDVFLSKDKNVVFLGAAYDVKSGKKMSIPVDMQKFVQNKAFTFGTGKDEYVVFTDPECPYCKQFESYWEQIKDKVKFHVFLLPLDFHPNSKEMSYYILSKSNDQEKIKVLHQMSNGSREYKNVKFSMEEINILQKSLKKQMDVANELSVRGTPTMFDMNGGNVSWPEILNKYGVKLK